MRLLLVFPVSSNESERIWSRCTITHRKRLNSVAMCHVHKLTLDTVYMEDLSKTFMTRSYQRRNELGTIFKLYISFMIFAHLCIYLVVSFMYTLFLELRSIKNLIIVH